MTLRLTTGGPVARLFINRAERRNAFNQAMWELLPELVGQAMADPAVRVLTIESAHPGIFSAGADIAELLTNKDDSGWLAANQAAINISMPVHNSPGRIPPSSNCNTEAPVTVP